MREKENRSGRRTTGATSENRLSTLALANLGAKESTLALDADFAAAQQIGYGCDCLFGVFGAGTDGENQIAEGKFWSGLQDQIVSLHIVSILEHIRCHFVQSFFCLPLSFGILIVSPQALDVSFSELAYK